MQLHALFGRGVLAHGLLRRLDVRGHQHHLVLELVVAVAAAHRDPVAVLQTRAQRVGLGLNGLGAVVAAALAAQKQLAVDRGGAVREGEGDDLRLTVLGLAHLEGGDLAAHHQSADVLGDLPHLDDGIVNHLAVERVRGRRRGFPSVALQILGGVHGQHLGFLRPGGVDFLNAALVVAGALELHLHREIKELFEQFLKHAIHALHAQVLRTLAAGDVHGEHIALQLPCAAAVQEVHRAGAVMGQQLLQKPGCPAHVRAHDILERRVAQIQRQADGGEGGCEGHLQPLVFRAGEDALRAELHRHPTGLFRYGYARQRETAREIGAVPLNQLSPEF